jgi:Zn-dependent protease with chaperone function
MTNLRIIHRGSGGRLRGAVALCAMLGVGCVAAGCQSMLSLTRRSDALSPTQQSQIGVLAYQEWCNTHEPVKDERQIEVVRRVGQRLADASGRRDLQWQFDVVVERTPQVVAFPGGKVVVSDALLGLCENEGLLAAAMSHEMGHMLAGHGLERLRSHDAQLHSGKRRPPMPAAAFAAGDSAHAWPYSPQHETEADSIALSLMVRAGYDPEAAHTFWTRTAAEQSSPQFNGLARLHSVNRHRLTQLESSLAQARTMYRSRAGQIGIGESLAFEVHHDPPPEPVQPSRAPTATVPPARIAPSLWTATETRGAEKPSTWNSDLKSPDVTPLAAHAEGPTLPPDRPIRQAAYDAPDNEEWLTPILRPAD